MPPITALLHTKNDSLGLGRALETLLPCSEILKDRIARCDRSNETVLGLNVLLLCSRSRR